MNQNIKGLIFDIFGVLCDSYNGKWEKENLSDKPHLHAEFGQLSDEIDLGKKFQSDYYQLAARAVKKSPEEIRTDMEKGFRINTRLFELILKLRKSYKLGICSNSGAKLVRPMFENAGYPLERYFDYVGISSEIGILKPYSAMFDHCAKALGLESQYCVFIDDTLKNIQGAEKAGMQTYHFTTQSAFEDWMKSSLSNTSTLLC